MTQLKIKTFRDLMQHGECTIHCMYTGNQVRILTVNGENCHVLAGDGTELDVPLDTPIIHEPWCFDRGNLIFEHDGQQLKICGEADVLRTSDGTQYQVTP